MNGFRHPKDPLSAATPDAGRTLFHKLADACDGFSEESVINASVNLALNMLRQRYSTRAAAERGFDELMGRCKTLLLDRHYDGVGKRRNVFPFAQTIDVPLVDLSKRG